VYEHAVHLRSIKVESDYEESVERAVDKNGKRISRMTGSQNDRPGKL
jgi:hypothetical protein